MSGTTPELPGQGGQQNDQNGTTPPPSMPPLPPLPWEQQGAQPPQPDPYAAPAYGGAPQEPYAARAPQDPSAAPQHPSYAAQPTAQQPPQTAVYATQPYGTPPYGIASQPVKRKGMPTWAWWVIGVGAVVVVGAIVAVTAVINLILPHTGTAGAGGDTGGDETVAGDTGTGTGADFPLAAVVPAMGFAFDVPGLEGWTTSEQEDFYTFAENDSNLCVFEAQTIDIYGADPAAADDAAATAADFPAYFEEIGEGTQIVAQDFTEVESVAIDSAVGTIEFATFDSTITWSDGSEYLERWYFRSYVDSGATMSAYLSCPAEDFTAATLGETIDALTIH